MIYIKENESQKTALKKMAESFKIDNVYPGEVNPLIQTGVLPSMKKNLQKLGEIELNAARWFDTRDIKDFFDFTSSEWSSKVVQALTKSRLLAFLEDICVIKLVYSNIHLCFMEDKKTDHLIVYKDKLVVRKFYLEDTDDELAGIDEALTSILPRRKVGPTPDFVTYSA